MKRFIRCLFAVTCLLVPLIVACDLLAPAEFDPSGTTFTLNSDINVVSITGSPQTSPNGPMTMAVTVSSVSGSATSDVLPAGLFFRRRDTGNQHVILLKDQTIATNASGNRTTQLGAFCCNRTLRQPGIDDAFDIGPITDDADLQRIISLVRNKNITDGNDMFMVQRAVWMVTDSTGLTQAYVDSINALPPAR
jgi:hypothetical protein